MGGGNGPVHGVESTGQFVGTGYRYIAQLHYSLFDASFMVGIPGTEIAGHGKGLNFAYPWENLFFSCCLIQGGNFVSLDIVATCQPDNVIDHHFIHIWTDMQGIGYIAVVVPPQLPGKAADPAK